MDEKELLDVKLMELDFEESDEDESLESNKQSSQDFDEFILMSTSPPVTETRRFRTSAFSIPNPRISEEPKSTRKRQASSGARLNYLRTSGSLSRSIGSNKAARLRYDKWTPFNPSNNVLILFTGFGISTDNDNNRNLTAITKYFVPLGYVVYAFNYQTTSPGGHISSWKELRQDIHKFLKFVISPKAYVFLYCRSAGCLVILDYILHQHGIQEVIKGIVLSKPALSFLEPSYSRTVGLNRITKLLKSFSWTKGENTTSKFLSELMKSSRYIYKHAHKLTIPLLLLQYESVSTEEADSLIDNSMNIKFFHEVMFSKKKDMIIYPSTFLENNTVGRSKVISDIHAWLKLYEIPAEDIMFLETNHWSLLPQELKCSIFSYLDIGTICRVASVNKSWKNLTSICLEEIDLSGEKQRNCRELIRYVSSFPFLKSLNLEGWSTITDNDVEYICERCQTLQKLKFGGCWQITDITLYILGENCFNLRNLNLRACPKITNDGLATLAKYCPLLESLNLSKCTQITSEGLQQLAINCPYIIELDLSYFKLGRIQSGLELFTQLQVLYLEGRQLRTSDDDDNEDLNGHLEALFQHLPNLQTLSLQGSSKVSPKARENISRYCTKLVNLNLKNT